MGGLKKQYIEKGLQRKEKKEGEPGRSEKPVNWDLVDNLLMSGCTSIEIASHFDMHFSTLTRKIKEKFGMDFTEYSFEKRKQGDSLLKHTQYMKALGKTDKGDNTLLIWLGKNRLEQRETPLETNFSEESLNQFGALMKQFQDLQARKIEETKSNEESKS